MAFIFNPKAGRKQKPDIKDLIKGQIDNTRYKSKISVTEYAGHAHVLTGELVKKGYKKIVAVGGDGTVNEIASAIVNLDASLGIIPTGSGNGLAYHLGIPKRMNKAFEILNKGNTVKIDAGKLNENWFFCTCGVGFDARIGHKFAKNTKRGFLPYAKEVIKEFRQYRSKKYKFFIDGEKFVRRAFLITVANAGQYGNNAYIAPGAKIDDGLFDICILKPFPVWKVFSLAVKLFRQSIDRSDYLETLKGKHIRFKKPKKKYLFHFDGEPTRFKKEKINITMHHKCLEVMVP